MRRQRGATLAELCALLCSSILYQSTPLLYYFPSSRDSPPLAIGFTTALRDVHQPLDLTIPCRIACWGAFWSWFWTSAHRNRSSQLQTFALGARILEPYPRIDVASRSQYHNAPSLPQSLVFPVPLQLPCDPTSHLPRYGLGSLVSEDNLAQLKTRRCRIPTERGWSWVWGTNQPQLPPAGLWIPRL